ncbi:hypothetical protein C4546_00840 [Candidatus Parcubacteria bacterium]|nr:MAG: hypothetical protein C4546_00840 [Candidatus Parcubacteria bacterium]
MAKSANGTNRTACLTERFFYPPPQKTMALAVDECQGGRASAESAEGVPWACPRGPTCCLN